MCLILKNIVAQKISDISRRWGEFWEEEEGEAAVEGAIFSTSISLKNITHCRLRYGEKGKQLLSVASLFPDSVPLDFARCSADIEVSLSVLV